MKINHYISIIKIATYIDSYEFKLSDNGFTFFVGGDAWPMIVHSAALSTLFSLQNQSSLVKYCVEWNKFVACRIPLFMPR